MSVELSIVLPIYNEADAIEGAISRLEDTLAPLGLGYEIVCINDGSRDGTGERLDRLAQERSALRIVHFTRNFGKEAALHAGLEAARGDAAIFMDADLQHPPELIPQMVSLWREGGYDVVDARKRRRGSENGLYALAVRAFYGLLSGITQSDMSGASDYKLLSRAAMSALSALPERNRFFRGLVAWVGYPSTQVEFDVAERAVGSSGWGRFALIRYGIDSILAFTTFPLVAIALIGLATTAAGSLLGAAALYQWASGVAVSGFTTVILMLLIFSGLILISLGTVSLYLARLFEEVKGRPLYVIRPEKPGREA